MLNHHANDRGKRKNLAHLVKVVGISLYLLALEVVDVNIGHIQVDGIHSFSTLIVIFCKS